ncbi:MAG: threonine synthase, partial [Ruminiclostridium sp.]|nr:threonine synthase [Ruminiclostridium sp.]
TSIMVFYPEDGVSNMQKRQMTTQEGSNVNVCAVVGNFDDCQTGVKQIFTDKSVIAELDKANTVFSSANSINWGRLAPQIIYYVSSYVQLVKDGELKYGEKLNVVVPTGNFGNILAAYYAKQMGIPIGKLICASNANNVLTDFINTGIYDRNRHFYTTVSPSMDILISSNLERLLYHLTGEDDKLINEWFTLLKNEGRYEVNDSVKTAIKENFYAGCCNDDDTKAAIKEVFDEYSYLMDTHTAVAYKVYEDYKKNTGDTTKTLIASTANPYKFGFAVYDALGGETAGVDEFELISKLEKLTNTTCPRALSDTKNKAVRFTGSIKPENMAAAVLDFINK